MTVGEKIDYFAKQKKYSLRRLASESGVNYNTLYAIVSRKSERVSDDIISKIAAVLEIPKEQLLSGSEMPKEPASEAEIKLSATINSIIGLSTGKEREDKLYLINSFLEAQTSLIKDVFAAINTNGEKE